jgi:hypothetical protein
MIREKSVLAEEIVGSGEEWLWGFDVKQLRDLVALEEGEGVGGWDCVSLLGYFLGLLLTLLLSCRRS